MNIAFIGFGKVAFNLVKLINSPDIEFTTSDEKRSKDTVELINEANIRVCPTFIKSIENADIVVSANTPSKAVEVAREYGKYCNGIYLDLNNVSPKTALEINDLVPNFVDGAIIGKIDSENPVLYLSGSNAEKLLFLNDFLDVRVISDNVGDASNLKLLRSSYTKALSVLLVESYRLAESMNLENEFFDVLSLTEGDDFKEKSLSRINNTLKSLKRKGEELGEILDYYDNPDLQMLETALKKLKQFEH